MKVEISDRKIDWPLEMMKPVVLQISETFGVDCEVVLHDLSHPKSTVVMVANGQVTGRTIGQGFSDLVHILRSPHLQRNQLSNYYKTTPDGRIIKSSTSLLKDSGGEIIGTLCINFDLGKHLQAKRMFEDFCKTIDLRGEEAQDNNSILTEDVSGILDRILRQVIGDVGIPVAMMDREQKLDIVRFLDEKEVFTIKGAVDALAKQFGVTRYTIYNYLEETRSRKQNEKKNGKGGRDSE